MIKDAIVERFKKICKQRGISYTELARLAGMTPSTVYSMLESERRNINVITLKKLCDGLEMSMAEFFSDSVFENLPPEVE